MVRGKHPVAEVSRETVDEPADYAWRLVHLRTGAETWVNEDDVRRDAITRRIFQGRPEGEPATHTIEKVGADGETRYGPADL